MNQSEFDILMAWCRKRLNCRWASRCRKESEVYSTLALIAVHYIYKYPRLTIGYAGVTFSKVPLWWGGGWGGEGRRSPKRWACQHNILANFHRKLHRNKVNWRDGARVAGAPLDTPLKCYWYWPHTCHRHQYRSLWCKLEGKHSRSFSHTLPEKIHSRFSVIRRHWL